MKEKLTTDAPKRLCSTLLETEQTIPKDSLFRDDLFDKVCEMIQDRNETRVIRDINCAFCGNSGHIRRYQAYVLDRKYE